MEPVGNKWTQTYPMYNLKRGVWVITDKGRNRVHLPIQMQTTPVNLVEIYEHYEEDFIFQLYLKMKGWHDVICPSNPMISMRNRSA